jgi:hypothetical protein
MLAYIVHALLAWPRAPHSLPPLAEDMWLVDQRQDKADVTVTLLCNTES